MSAVVKKIIKGDIVKIISGSDKGTTGKVLQVLPKKNAILVEGIGVKHRHVKPTRHNPQGGKKDIHVPTPIHKVALVVNATSGKTSRVGIKRNADGTSVRIARQSSDKEIK